MGEDVCFVVHGPWSLCLTGSNASEAEDPGLGAKLWPWKQGKVGEGAWSGANY